MSGVRARVRNGRLIVDEPTGLPEGTVLDLVLDDESDDLTADERRALDSALAQSLESAERGEFREISALLNDLRRPR